MGNFEEIFEQRTKEEKEKRAAMKHYHEAYIRDMEMLKTREEHRMAQIEKDCNSYISKVNKIIKKNNIPHHSTMIIVIEQDGKTHIYSRIDWFAPESIRDNCRAIITEFMQSIGKELVLDQDGNPTNDFEWHFENPRTDYHFILNALEKHGYC